MTIDVDGSSLPIAQGKKEDEEIKQRVEPKPANSTDETVQALEKIFGIKEPKA